jgi:hypothetical protein
MIRIIPGEFQLAFNTTESVCFSKTKFKGQLPQNTS